MERLRQ